MSHPERASSIRWRILALLVAMSFIAYVLRTNLSFAAPQIMGDLGLDEMQWGYIMAAFTAGYTIFQFPGGLLGDRFGPRRVLTVLMVTWAVLTALTSLVPGREAASVGLIIVAMMVVRFVVGATHAPTFPVLNASIVRWFPPGGWALPLGLSSTGLTLGAAAAAVAVPQLVAQVGWRTAFLWLSPIAVLVAVAWWRYSRDDPREHRGVSAGELAYIQGGAPAPPAAPDRAGDAMPWWRVLRNRDVLLLTLSYSSMNFVFYIVFNWFFYYLVEVREFSATDAGFVASAQWMAGAVGAALGGWLCDRLCRRMGLRWGCRWPVLVGMAASIVLLLVGAFHPSAAIAVGAMVLLFFFNQLNEGPYWATSIAVGGRHAGAAGGVMNTGANAMGIVNSLLVPFLALKFGWTVAIASAAVFAALGMLFMLLVRADCPVEPEDAVDPSQV